ncbi:DUF885 family protein [Lunatibacter salilacus]|uniref:DUF885 family protein n=1 Tax=Lunatibacter salilacus TaxID=2483804 RepID=UPI00131AEB53|nr:DUF885 family protein [Lunatibacter salilacus]
MEHPAKELSLICEKKNRHIKSFSTKLFLGTFAIISFNLCFSVKTLAQESLYELIETYNADLNALNRKYNVRETKEYYERMDAFRQDWLNQLSNMDFGSLGKDGQIDFILLKNKIEKDKHFMAVSYEMFQSLAFVADELGPLEKFYQDRRLGLQPDAPKFASSFHQIAEQIQAKTANLKNTPTFNSWQWAEQASEIIVSHLEAVKESSDFYFDYDPDFTWWMRKPVDFLVGELESYAAGLKDHYTNTLVKDDGSGIIGKPIGRADLIKELEYELIPYSPEELIAEAERQFAWCDREMLLASEALGYGNRWREALEHVKNTYVPPGQWPEDIHFLAEEAIAFVEERDLVTVPPLAKETWRMRMMSAEAQRVNPFFLGGELIQISYPTSTMTHPEKMMSMRGNNPHFSRATVQHELIPGHHLQGFMTQRHKPYRRAFSTPFWIEGWALYWEMNLWDKEFPLSPEDKIGMLFWRMHRCARIIFSLNYHLEKMTPQECIDFLVDRVGHERANAEAEVRRSFEGRYGPLYQIAYMIGGLQFYALKQELAEKPGFSEKEFHDTILKNNSIPVEIIRLIFLDENLDKAYTTQWKFLEKLQLSE